MHNTKVNIKIRKRTCLSNILVYNKSCPDFILLLNNFQCSDKCSKSIHRKNMYDKLLFKGYITAVSKVFHI